MYSPALLACYIMKTFHFYAMRMHIVQPAIILFMGTASILPIFWHVYKGNNFYDLCLLEDRFWFL